MANAWLIQANPRDYDIDGALRSLSRIWWRTPILRREIQVSDHIVIWRAKGGTSRPSGVVGVGRVTVAPTQHGIDPEEKPFLTNPGAFVENDIRTQFAVAPVDFISRDSLRETEAFNGHKIVSNAPQGTWFRLNNEQWSALERHVLAAEGGSDGSAATAPPIKGAGFGGPQLRDRSQRKGEPASYTRTEASIEIVQRECRLIERYEEWLGRPLPCHVIPTKGDGGTLETDGWDEQRGLLIEAKSFSGRAHIQMAIGQLLDYRRFLPDVEEMALLVPTRPADDLVELLHSLGIWDGEFKR